MALRVLIVEGEFLIAFELELLIEELGHEVVGISATCSEALGLVQQHRPDIATVDLRLKDGDNGEDLAALVLAEHGIRSIFISGNLDEDTRARLERLRPLGFVGKPFSRSTLARALTEAEV